ncbi:MAG TPA: ATP-binding protein [Bryobacteraceae bacterium]|nr:ATP-binding protein [Bryobacteraceae bacterium]
MIALERLRLPARIDSVKPFCEFARRVSAGAAFTVEDLHLLDLVVEEIMVNIALYAYGQPEGGEAQLGCALAGPRMLRIQICDKGRAFNPLASQPPDFSRGLAGRPVGGLGIFLVRSIAQSISYERSAGSNTLRFNFAPG